MFQTFLNVENLRIFRKMFFLNPKTGLQTVAKQHLSLSVSQPRELRTAIDKMT